MIQKIFKHRSISILIMLFSFIYLMTCRSNNENEQDTQNNATKNKGKSKIAPKPKSPPKGSNKVENKTPENANKKIENIKNTAGVIGEDETISSYGSDGADTYDSNNNYTPDDNIKDYENEGPDMIDTEVPPAMQLQVVEEEPKICIPKNKEGMLVPTVKLNYDKISKILPSDYKGHKSFVEDDKALRKAALSRLKDNFKLLRGVLYESSEHGANKGQDPLWFTVLPCKVKPVKSGIWYNRQRKHAKRRLRKLATRAAMAYTKATGECKEYNQVILVSVERTKAHTESGWDRFTRAFFPKNVLPKILHKRATLCINDAMDPIPTIKKKMSDEEREKRSKHLNIGITRLELVQIYLARRTIGRSDAFPIYNEMQEIDESTVLCYNAQVVDNRKIIRKKNQNVYVNVLAKYEWVGPLNAIGIEDYALEDKPNASYKRSTKKAVTKTLSPEYMVFAGYDVYNPFKQPYKGIIPSKIDNDYKPVAEYVTVWRLIINGVCVGVVHAADSEVALGTEEWENEKMSFGSFVKRSTGKFLRFFSRAHNKKAQGY